LSIGGTGPPTIGPPARDFPLYITVKRVTVMGVTVRRQAMKFYDRERELAELGKVEKQTGNSARMTVLTGRRRVGETSLALEFARFRKHLYQENLKRRAQGLLASYPRHRPDWLGLSVENIADYLPKEK
jgi:hypothetical protein